MLPLKKEIIISKMVHGNKKEMLLLTIFNNIQTRMLDQLLKMSLFNHLLHGYNVNYLVLSQFVYGIFFI